MFGIMSTGVEQPDRTYASLHLAIWFDDIGLIYYILLTTVAFGNRFQDSISAL